MPHPQSRANLSLAISPEPQRSCPGGGSSHAQRSSRGGGTSQHCAGAAIQARHAVALTMQVCFGGGGALTIMSSFMHPQSNSTAAGSTAAAAATSQHCAGAAIRARHIGDRHDQWAIQTHSWSGMRAATAADAGAGRSSRHIAVLCWRCHPSEAHRSSA